MRRCPTTRAFSIVVSMKLTPVRSATTRRTPERAALKKLSLNFTAVDMSASPSTAMTQVRVSGASSRREKVAVWAIADAFPCGMNQTSRSLGRTILRKGRYLRQDRSELDARGAEHLVRAEPGVDRLVGRWRELRRESDLPAAADAVTERLQAVGRRWAIPRKPAGLALGRRFAACVQRAVSVPSRCSSAFEVFCAAGSDLPSVRPGAW